MSVAPIEFDYKPHHVYNPDDWCDGEEEDMKEEPITTITPTDINCDIESSMPNELEEVRPPDAETQPFSMLYDSAQFPVNTTIIPTPVPSKSILRIICTFLFPIFFGASCIICFLLPIIHPDACNRELQIYIILSCVSCFFYFWLSITIIKMLPDDISSLALLERHESMKWLLVVLLKQLLGLYDFITFLYGNYYYFTSTPSCQDTSTPIFIYSTVMIVVGYIGIVLPIILFFVLAHKYPEYVFSRRGEVDKRLKPVSQKRINALPLLVYNDELVLHNDHTCSICLLAYEQGIHVRQLPCCHHYHQTCIDEWLLKKDSCPLCNRTLDECEKDRERKQNSSLLENDREISLIDNQV